MSDDPQTNPDNPDPTYQFLLQNRCQGEWSAIMKYGEFIKFIHNAIEWENVLYFTYPYFWDSNQNWPFKRFLMDNDPIHRSFLRAGCARVVLTIRPEFEYKFAQLMEIGGLFKDEPSLQLQGGKHPYVDIGQEIRDFAMTNYENIPPANPDSNARLLLYPKQQQAWKDMQDIIKRLRADPIGSLGSILSVHLSGCLWGL
jgi:hypothetical protein